jgi:KaiC/GvpD/RAD55 family RecA-like ATPase
MHYYRLCETTNDKGKLIPITEDVYKHIKSTDIDYYKSIYLFNDQQYKEFQERGSVAGMKDVVTNKLAWDFDNKQQPESAKHDAKKLIENLKSNGIQEESIQVFFSGSKGFEVSVELSNTLLTPVEAKNIAANLAKGLSSFDTSIYNATRILRVPLTKHDKSGLYKIPLSISDLDNDIEVIKANAKQNYTPDDIAGAWSKAQLTGSLKKLKDATPKIEKALISISPSLDFSTIDWTKKPDKISPEKYALSLGFFEEGERSHALMILASSNKALGMDEVHNYYALKAAADLQSTRTGGDKFSKEEIWKNIIQQVYSPLWMGGTYSVKTDSLLQKINAHIPASIKQQDMRDVVNISEGYESFKHYAKNINENTMEVGIPALDKQLNFQRGRLYSILGSPGSGKTSLAINMINNTSKSGYPSMFFSFDMSQYDVIQKLTQRHTGMKRDELYDIYTSGNQGEIDKVSRILQDNYANVSFVFKTGQSIDEMKESIVKREQLLGIDIPLIVVDYLELVQSKYSDPTQASSEIIQGLREIAINNNKIVIVLLQPNKMSSTVDQPITSYNAAKGSASVAQAVTAMLTVHRPGYSSRTPEDDNFFSIDCVKNRTGQLFHVDLAWNGLRGTIRELEEIEALTLQELLDRKRQDRDDDSLF